MLTQPSIQEILGEWPDDTRHTAETLIAKYGEPQEATPSRLMWFDNHPWKRTTLHRVGVQHDFPVPHQDTLEQAIDYRMPVGKACELFRFDGSLTIRRTAGELSAMCDGEAVNFLSINLADEICKGRTDVEGARRQFIESLDAELRGELTALTQGFTFSVMQGGSADPDVALR